MAERAASKELVTIPPAGTPTLLPMPAAAIIVLRQTPNAAFAAEEFFKATLSNEHTRWAYGRIVGHFLGWCDDRAGLSCARSRRASAANTSASSRARRSPGTRCWPRCGISSTPWCSGHAVALNPFASVRGVKYSVTEGKTDRRTRHRAGAKVVPLVDIGNVVGLRDRAVLGVLAYTGARIGAVARLRMADYRNLGDHRVLRFRKKAARTGRSPVRHDLAAWLNQYIAAKS